MEEADACDDRAGLTSAGNRLADESEAGSSVATAVELDERLAKQRESFRRGVADLPGNRPRLFEVEAGGLPSAPLRCVPDELADEERRLGFGRRVPVGRRRASVAGAVADCSRRVPT